MYLIQYIGTHWASSKRAINLNQMLDKLRDFLARLTPEQLRLLYILAALITLAGAIAAILKWGQGLLRTFWHWITRFRTKIPRETIRIVPRYRGLMWYMGSINRQPAMQVEGKWAVTNITDRDVILVKAYVDRKRTEGHVLVKHPHENVFGGYPILPGTTTDVSTGFWIQPPICKEGRDFRTTVILVDQFGNEHSVKNAVFKAPPPQEPGAPQPRQEALYAIADPIEKDVAAVLKAESTRYQEYGRRAGGLGSVQTTYRGQTSPSLGAEWRRADTPENQSIVQ